MRTLTSSSHLLNSSTRFLEFDFTFWVDLNQRSFHRFGANPNTFLKLLVYIIQHNRSMTRFFLFFWGRQMRLCIRSFLWQSCIVRFTFSDVRPSTNPLFPYWYMFIISLINRPKLFPFGIHIVFLGCELLLLLSQH